MVVKTAVEYINDQLANRVRQLQEALNKAEQIINTLDKENQRLKDALVSLASENNEGYVLHDENFNDPILTV
jgi:ABC-type transporter Mla subunit MlaD